jgi:microcystin-dependent protein
MYRSWLLSLLILVPALLHVAPAVAQDNYLGEIRFVAFNFAPQGWATCDGQLLPINENQALFSLLGTTFGGDGVNNFALPNLQSRVPLGMGQGSELSSRTLGEIGGQEQIWLTAVSADAFFGEAWGNRNVTLSTMPPFLTLNCIIALQGIFPSQNVLPPSPGDAINSAGPRSVSALRRAPPGGTMPANDPGVANLLIETVKAQQSQIQWLEAEIGKLKVQLRPNPSP